MDLDQKLSGTTVFKGTKSEISVKVLTLNCWGLWAPLSKHKNVRIEAISEMLNESDYDIVALQEVWDKSDFDLICDKVVAKYPSQRYFYSGVIGSGLAILCKHLIVRSFYHPFSLNGYWFMITHGDYMGKKGVGYIRTVVNGMFVDVFTTHLHAQYDLDAKKDPYTAHRTAQVLEIADFVKFTSSESDMVVVAGDFNSHPQSTCINIVQKFARMSDAWTCTDNNDEFEGTCDRPENPYANEVVVKSHPKGQRLDYVFFKGGPGIDVVVKEAVIIPGEIPGHPDKWLSDHEGVSVTFKVKPSKTKEDAEIHTDPEALKLLTECKNSMQLAFWNVSDACKFWLFMAACILIFGIFLLIFYHEFFIVPVGIAWSTGFLLSLAMWGFTKRVERHNLLEHLTMLNLKLELFRNCPDGGNCPTPKHSNFNLPAKFSENIE